MKKTNEENCPGFSPEGQRLADVAVAVEKAAEALCLRIESEEEGLSKESETGSVLEGSEKSGKKTFHGFLACPLCGRGDQYYGLEDGSSVVCKWCGKRSMLSGLCLVEFKEDKMPVVTPGDIEPGPHEIMADKITFGGELDTHIDDLDQEPKAIRDIQQEQRQFKELYDHLFGLKNAEALSGGNLCPACSHKNDVDGYISGDSKTCEGCGANLDFKEGDLTSRDYIPGSIISTEEEKIQALVDAHWNYKQKDLTIGADRNRVYTFDEVMEIRKWDYTSSAVHFYKHGFDAARYTA